MFTYAAFNQGGESAPATVTVTVTGRPDPTQQPNVVGTVAAQMQAAQRFARAQISNFSRRLESLHRGGRPQSGQAAGAANVAGTALPSVEDPFAEVAPGTTVARTEERRIARNTGVMSSTPRLADGSRPGTTGMSTQPDDIGLGTRALAHVAAANGFGNASSDAPRALLGVGGGLAADIVSILTSRSINLAQLSGQGASAKPATDAGGMDFWIEGSLNWGNRGTAAAGGQVDFSTSGISLGVDRRMSEQLVVGAGLGFARDRTDIGNDGSKSVAKGVSVAVYGSYQPTRSTFVDALIGVGTLNFDNERFVAPIGAMAKSERDGTQIFGSLAAGIEARRAGVLISPYGRIDVSHDRLKDGTETGAGNFALHYFGQRDTSVQGALGLRFESSHPTSFGWVSPRARIELKHNFEGDQLTQIAYADQILGQRYSISTPAVERNAVAFGVGADFFVRGGFSLGADYQMQKSFPQGSSQGVRLRLTQALDGKGARRPSYEAQYGEGGGAAHHDSSDIRFDVGFTYDDNVTRGRLSTEKLQDGNFTLSASKTEIFPINDNMRFFVVGSLGGDKFHTYKALDRLFASVRGELQYRGSAEFSSPILAAFGRVTGEQFDSNIRRGYRASVGVSARQPLTDRILLFASLAHNERFAKSDVFDTRDNALQLNLDYALSSDSALYLAGEHRRGDVVSSGQGSLANIDVAKVLVLDDAFTNTQTFAYKIGARTNILTLGYNLSFGTRDSLDFSWRRARSTPDLRPGFSAPGPWHYIVDQLSVVYLMRF
jgi:outer membrane autotransporter protein